ncbi:MAG: alanine dehydrogenase [Gammaproteobacteria bacterium]|nr:MAG: alanine dehydrogenase [Gammaproteobacteria bacterium]
MLIGIPKETKTQEGRVALTPRACAELVGDGHQVLVQKDSGLMSGYTNEEYQAAGVEILDEAMTVYSRAELIVKVKEPSATEVEWMRPGQLLFCFLHLAALPELTTHLLSSKVTALGFEIVSSDGALPLLAPMSQIAGRLSVQIGAYLLHSYTGGKGLLLGGVKGTETGAAVILGAGNAGQAALHDLAAVGAQVHVFDRNRNNKFAPLQEMYPDCFFHVSPDPDTLSDVLQECDLLIGAVLSPGMKAPVLVSEEQVKLMPKGSVIIDIAIDQGGCVETSRPTSYDHPTFITHDVLHFGVTNMPGAVSRTATQALSSAILPYLMILANDGFEKGSELDRAIYVENGRIRHPGIASLES